MPTSFLSLKQLICSLVIPILHFGPRILYEIQISRCQMITNSWGYLGCVAKQLGNNKTPLPMVRTADMVALPFLQTPLPMGGRTPHMVAVPFS
jgi:hypothetical protein